MPNPWEGVLDFWFGPLDDGISGETYQKRWFTPDPSFDKACYAYAPLLNQARDGTLAAWTASARGTLAFIVLCDQLPRNIYRGTATAYDFDDMALEVAQQGVRQRQDRELGWDERSFFYLPFEHSEDLIDQHTSVGLFTQLRDASPPHLRARTGNTLRFAHQHREVIERFGRFPHRNAVLSRPSDEQELEFIARGDGFGQNPTNKPTA